MTSGPAASAGALDRLIGVYPRAEVTTAIVHDRRGGDRHVILYAVAELCPPDQPQSPAIGDPRFGMHRERLEEDALTLYLRRDDVSPAVAVGFFRGTGGIHVLPGVPPLVSATPLADVTRDEEIVLIPSNLAALTGPGAVLPRRPTGLGVVSKLDTSDGLRGALGDRAIARALSLVHAHLGVDLGRFSEHLGAVHLCVANPVLRGFERSITSDERTLLVRCYERAGCSVVGCELELSNEWPSLGAGFCVRHVITAPFFSLPLPAPPQSLRVRLFDTSGRCIEDESAAFVRRVGLDIGISSRRRVVFTGPGGEQETHDVRTVSYDRPRSTAVEPPHPLVYLAQAQRQRELDDLATARVFVFFPGGDESRRQAREIVRELLGRARERCSIVDPYLSADDVVTFVPFIATNGCHVRLLSSNAFLRERRDDGSTNEQHLVARLEELKALPLSVDCKKMPGHDRSPVHDRLMAIDDDVYLLGSSLSEFGSRATTLFKVPDPRGLLREIDEWCRNSAHLESTRRSLLSVEMERLSMQVRAAGRTAGKIARLTLSELRRTLASKRGP